MVDYYCFCSGIANERDAVYRNSNNGKFGQFRCDSFAVQNTIVASVQCCAYRATAGVLMEELLPGRETSGSREQRRDQKRAVGEAIHGAHRQKEEERVRTDMCAAHSFGCTAVRY